MGQQQTLSREHDAGPDAREDVVPQLFVWIECDRPAAGSTRHVLDGVERVELGRGSERRTRRDRGTLSLTVPDGRMSEPHARFVREGGGWVVEDLGSKNGVLVDGDAHPRTRLVDGMILEIGHTLVRYREAPVASGAALDVALAGQRVTETFDARLARAFDDLGAVAATRAAIVIYGESGTGKELVAREAHQLGRRSGAFVAVNCGALPANLVEAELFGYRKGAFSGADQDRPGIVRSADRGTLFLDEIADLPAAAQAALLRVLQEREVTPLGSAQAVPVDLQVIAASHQDLAAAVEHGEFRRDLYARLAAFTLALPPLRERRDDLGVLLAALVTRVAGVDARLSAAVARALAAYDWPLNIRELESALTVAAALARGGPIKLEHLPEEVRAGAQMFLANLDAEDRERAPARAPRQRERGRARHRQGTSADPSLAAPVSPRAGCVPDMSPPDDKPTVHLGRGSDETRSRSIDAGADVPAIPRTFAADDARFEEVGELGRGGMGRVADVFDRRLQRRVAVKQVLATSEDAFARFEREARITARLEHPGIVPVYEAGRAADGTPYYVMRRIAGKPLGELVEGRDLDARLALVPALLTACDAVAYAHAQGVVHRDLKPSNIVVGGFGETLVIDWGLARELAELAELDEATRVAGTPGFMAPEQARGETVDERADVFALGATLFIVLAGVAPYDLGDTTLAIEAARARRAPEWGRMPGGVPRDLRAIVEKALAPLAADRYRDAGALAADLRRYVTGQLVAAHRYGPREQVARFVRKHRAAVAIAVVSTIVLAGGTWWSIRRIVASRDIAISARDDAKAATLRVDAARQREQQRADELLLAQARLLLDVDPTLAVATASPKNAATLPGVAAIYAAASARGVAAHITVPPSTWMAEMAPDGAHAVTLDGSGVVSFHDLAARTSRVVFRFGRAVSGSEPISLSFADDAHLAVFDGKTLVLVDVVTGGQRSLPLTDQLGELQSGPAPLYWTDRAGAVWRLDAATAEPVAVAMPAAVHRLWVSEDRTQFVASTPARTWFIARGRAPVALADGPSDAATWDLVTGTLYLATHAGSLQQIDVTSPAPHAIEIGKAFVERLVARDGVLYLQGRGPVAPQIPNRNFTNWNLVRRVRDGVAVAQRDGKVTVYDATQAYPLASSLTAVDMLLDAPRSPYVVVLSGGDLLVWNLSPVLPHAIAQLDTASWWVRPAGAHHAMVLSDRSKPFWIDLQTGTRSEAPGITDPTRDLLMSPAWSRTCELAGDGTLHLLRIGTTSDTVLARDVERATFVDEQHVVIARNGSLELIDVTDVTDPHPVTLAKLDATPIWLLARGDHVLAGLTSGVAWLQISTRELQRPALDWQVGIALAPDGAVWFAAGRDVKAWRAGATSTIATLAEPITYLMPAGEHTLACDTAHRGYFVDTATGTAVPTIAFGSMLVPQPTGPPRVTTRVTGRGGPLLAMPSNNGGARIVDPGSGLWWPVGKPWGENVTTRLSPDGTVLYEQRRQTLVTWPIAMPRTAAEADAFRDHMTNAVLGPAGDLAWREPAPH
jgi:hypothetical protein